MKLCEYLCGNEVPQIGVSDFHNDFSKKTGAGEAIRTPDPNLGKVMLYP